MSDFDDLLGDCPPTPARAASEDILAMTVRRAEMRRAAKGDTKVKLEEFFLPVSQNFLARVLQMDSATVGKRLMHVAPAGVVGDRKVYNFADAIAFLVKPKMDIATYLRTLNPAHMPNSINKVFWEAERIKNKTLIETGEAWPTPKVLETLGVVFMMIKDRIPLISEGMRDAGLADDQQAKLMEFLDQFQADLHGALVEMPLRRQTYSRQVEIDPSDGPEIRDDDDEFEAAAA